MYRARIFPIVRVHMLHLLMQVLENFVEDSVMKLEIVVLDLYVAHEDIGEKRVDVCDDRVARRRVLPEVIGGVHHIVAATATAATTKVIFPIPILCNFSTDFFN